MNNNSKLFLIIALFFIVQKSFAQPGWQDYTSRYFYTILDDNDKEISFKSDKLYQIQIDDIVYKNSTIPNDSLPIAEENSSVFYNYIKINDFSLRLAQSKYNQKPVEIKIIHKKDTLFINQSTGTGSTKIIYETSETGSRFGKRELFVTDKTIKFIPGHYYFPEWSNEILNNLPITEGNIHIKNVKQSHFIIPKKVYEKLAITFNYNERGKLIKEADEYVCSKFMKSMYTISKTEQAIKLDSMFKPYKSIWGYKEMYPTKNPDEYYGLIQYNLDTLNHSIAKNVFARFNKKENTITHWKPKPSLTQFYTYKLYIDTYNDVIYQTAATREPLKLPCTITNDINCPYSKTVYFSTDEGLSWQEHPKMKQLFEDYKFREFAFIDKNYSLGFNLRDIKMKGKKYKIQQGTYYLFKNFKLIDSLTTPDTVHYNSNYNHYNFNHETKYMVLLGKWTQNERYNYDSKHFQPSLVQDNESWKFNISEQIFVNPINSNTFKEPIKLLNFKHFNVMNGSILIMKSNSSKLILNRDLPNQDFENNFTVLENKNQIYLLNKSTKTTLFSVDSGINWYYYPLPFSATPFLPSSYLEINEANEITYFTLYGLQNNLFKKITYKFIL